MEESGGSEGYGCFAGAEAGFSGGVCRGGGCWLWRDDGGGFLGFGFGEADGWVVVLMAGLRLRLLLSGDIRGWSGFMDLWFRPRYRTVGHSRVAGWRRWEGRDGFEGVRAVGCCGDEFPAGGRAEVGGGVDVLGVLRGGAS